MKNAGFKRLRLLADATGPAAAARKTAASQVTVSTMTLHFTYFEGPYIESQDAASPLFFLSFGAGEVAPAANLLTA